MCIQLTARVKSTVPSGSSIGTHSFGPNCSQVGAPSAPLMSIKKQNMYGDWVNACSPRIPHTRVAKQAQTHAYTSLPARTLTDMHTPAHKVTPRIPQYLSRGIHLAHGSGGIPPSSSRGRMARQYEAAHTTTGTHLNVWDGWAIPYANAKVAIEWYKYLTLDCYRTAEIGLHSLVQQYLADTDEGLHLQVVRRWGLRKQSTSGHPRIHIYAGGTRENKSWVVWEKSCSHIKPEA